jgi:hypothetical protein
VIDRIIQLARGFINREHNQDPALMGPNIKHLLAGSPKDRKISWDQIMCPVCIVKSSGKRKFLNGALEWEIHCNTGGHKKQMERKKKFESGELYMTSSKPKSGPAELVVRPDPSKSL